MDSKVLINMCGIRGMSQEAYDVWKQSGQLKRKQRDHSKWDMRYSRRDSRAYKFRVEVEPCSPSTSTLRKFPDMLTPLVRNATVVELKKEYSSNFNE